MVAMREVSLVAWVVEEARGARAAALDGAVRASKDYPALA